MGGGVSSPIMRFVSVALAMLHAQVNRGGNAVALNPGAYFAKVCYPYRGSVYVMERGP